jgi:hypothetical protein
LEWLFRIYKPAIQDMTKNWQRLERICDTQLLKSDLQSLFLSTIPMKFLLILEVEIQECNSFCSLLSTRCLMFSATSQRIEQNNPILHLSVAVQQ